MSEQPKKPRPVRVVVYQCPEHEKFITLTVEPGNGRTGGTRVCGGKCCPKQYHRTLNVWNLDAAQASAMIEELQHLLESYTPGRSGPASQGDPT
jgi:hypothetical protein